MGRFPVTLYKEQWLRLLAMADDIRDRVPGSGVRVVVRVVSSGWVPVR